MAAFGALSRSAMLYCRKAALSPKPPLNELFDQVFPFCRPSTGDIVWINSVQGFRAMSQ